MRTLLFFLPVLSFVLPFAACGSGGIGGAGGETTTNPCIVSPESCMGTCAGECADEPFGFAGLMVMLWSGPMDATPPACPDDAPVPSLGYLDTPPDSVMCSQCTCGPSQGVCFPPSSMKANHGACPANGSGVEYAPFNSPAVWDGTCTSPDPVSSVDSFTVSPAFLPSSSACAPSGVEPVDVQGGKTRSLTCTSPSHLPEGKCPEGRACAFGKVDGFSVCVVDFFDDVGCPPGWPVKHLNYDEYDLCDCSCGDPMGEMCSTTVTVYQDGACTKPLGSATVSAGKPAACVDLPPGSTLGSKSATPPAYNAGTCAPKLTKNHPWTLCCLP